MTKAYLGIDVAKSKFDVALLLNNNFKSGSFSNSSSGFEALLAWLKNYAYGELHGCMEATGIYGEQLANFLFDKELKISVVNPARIKGFGKSKLSRTKTDESDAKLIAQFCQAMQPDLWSPTPEHVQLLRNLVRRLDSLKSMRQQEQNRLESACDEVKASIKRLLKVLYAEVLAVEKNVRDVINNNPELKDKDKLIQSIPGVGDTTSALVLSFLWDVNNFVNAKQVAAFVGLNPRQRQSGSSLNGRTMLSKVGDAQLRKWLYMPAMTAIRYNPLVKKFGERLAKNGKNKMQIIGAVMRKLVHIMYGVLKSGRPFDHEFA